MEYLRSTPYIISNDGNESEISDDYQNAAEILKEYENSDSSRFSTSVESIEAALGLFISKYSPEILESLDDDSLLSYIFFTSGDNSNALCYWLENNKECREYFGSIAGGSAFKFGLFQKKETGIWMTGSSQKPQELTENEALIEGKRIRDALVKGVRIIREAELDSVKAYEKLDDKLKQEVGSQYYDWSWFHKYFSMICNDKLSGFHSGDWQYHILRALHIKPSSKYYARSGQIAMIQNYAGWYYRQFFDVFDSCYGDPKVFVRLGSTAGPVKYADEWARNGVVAVGWSGVGDLSAYVKGDNIDRSALQTKLQELYFPSDKINASKKAGEIVRFYKSDKNTVFVVMDGEKLIALADNVGKYKYVPESDMGHQRTATWKYFFDEDEKMPQKAEGKLTTVCELKNEENLLFLYDKYYYGDNSEASMTDDTVTSQDFKSIVFNTGYNSGFSRNRIVFGAPGTGKSYTVNSDRKKLLGYNNETDYERVTFHPDYSYANFVGTYKPVPVKDSRGNDTITYSYVPGPFMRVYVEAIKNGRTGNPKPYLLIIEEINRANVAAVFGDIFQLLDRGDDNVSEYSIQASEDVKKYLAKELNIMPEECNKIKIPDNMFIWATMNSADQGVYPMDTAFKRRWDFTYLGIDDSDEDIRDKYVTLGPKGNRYRIIWNDLRKAINDFLATEKINEDKQLGPYFIARNVVVPVSGTEIDSVRFSDVFKHKVLMYLFEDAAKQKRAKLFEGISDGKLRYSEICKAFDENGIDIFHNDIRSHVTKHTVSTDEQGDFVEEVENTEGDIKPEV